jgi:uncharacterized membrane protein (GlpM family)
MEATCAGGDRITRRLLLIKDSYPPDTLPIESRMALEELLPADRVLNIAVIAYTIWMRCGRTSAKPSPSSIIYWGFAYLGHAVWVFVGHRSALEMGSWGPIMCWSINACCLFGSRLEENRPRKSARQECAHPFHPGPAEIKDPADSSGVYR